MRRNEVATMRASQPKRGLVKTSSYSSRSEFEMKQRKNLENTRSRITREGPFTFRWAERTTFVSKTALSILVAALAAIALYFEIDSAVCDWALLLFW